MTEAQDCIHALLQCGLREAHDLRGGGRCCARRRADLDVALEARPERRIDVVHGRLGVRGAD